MAKGIIKISDLLYKSDYDVLCVIFKDFRPIHIEFKHWENDVWWLWGESDKFKELKEGDAIPFYYVTFTTNEDGSVTYEFETNN